MMLANNICLVGYRMFVFLGSQLNPLLWGQEFGDLGIFFRWRVSFEFERVSDNYHRVLDNTQI